MAGMRMVFGVLALAAVTPARADEAAGRFLEGLYARYVGGQCEGPQFLGEPAKARRYFTPETVRLFERAWKKDPEGPPAPGFDVLINAQDCEIKARPKVAVEASGPEAARATVTFTNFKDRVEVRHDLVKTKQGWRIHDIRWPASDMKDGLRAVLGAP